MLYNLLTEQVLLPLSDTALSTTFWKTFQKWKEIEKKSSDELEVLQLKALEDLLFFASEKVPFYKYINYKEDTKAFLSQFPILTKKMLKEEDLLSVKKDGLIKRSSSGSSGVQSTVYLNKVESGIPMSIQALWWSWAGFRFGNKVLQTGINTNRGVVKKLKDILLRFKYVDAFSLSEDEIVCLLKELQKYPKQHLIGYASSLYSIAKTAQKYNINDVKFDSVMSLGDKMFDHYRRLIQDQFSTKVFDTYGCSEGLMMAGECEFGNYHIMTPHIYLEILDNNNCEVEVGEIGQAVVTRLDAYSMPLIRYKLGDMLVKGNSEKECACGRSFPILGKVIGRETDLLHLASGKFLTVHSFAGIFEYFSEIKQFQVIELEDGIMIRYIKDNGFTDETIKQVKQKIYDKIDKNLKVVFKEEVYIRPTASGKPCMVMSKEKATEYLKGS